MRGVRVARRCYGGAKVEEKPAFPKGNLFGEAPLPKGEKR
jgi:hypothetical protein